MIVKVIGIKFTACWKAYQHEENDDECTITEFVYCLSFEFINNQMYNGKKIYKPNKLLSPLEVGTRYSPRCTVMIEKIQEANTDPDLSPLTDDVTQSFSTAKKARKTQLQWADFSNIHEHSKNTSVDSLDRSKRCLCKICGNKTQWICMHCKYFVCPNIQGHRIGNCYKNHIKNAHPGIDL